MNGISTALWLGAAAVVFELGLYCFGTLGLDAAGIALTVLVFPVCLMMALSNISAVQKRVDKWFGADDE